jgi:flagellar hook-length control protein FliK
MISVLDGIREAVVQDIQGEDNGLADRIIKQITDDIKMYANQNTTSLEIQLEPESLGKVSLTVASKSGSVTAQLMVQNEVAKEAIESQISTLKETMNNQGIKIEAIEVTVASREFEENLDKQNNNSEHQEQRNRRHLSDEELAEINGITVSEDKIREEIMKEMGNTVSYSA